MKKKLPFIFFIAITLIVNCGSGKKSIERESVTEESLLKPDTIKKVEPKIVTQPVTVTEQKKVQTFEIESKKPVEKIKEDTITAKPFEQKVKAEIVKKDTIATKLSTVQKPIVKEKKESAVVTDDEKKGIIHHSKINEMTLALLSTTFEDIYFDQGEYKMPSMTFNSNYIMTIAKIVKALRTDKDVKVRLFGHTGNSGVELKNRELGFERAKTIGKLILEMFDDNEKEVMSNRIEIISVGNDNPMVTSKDKAKDFLNRRVSVELTYDKATLGKLYAELSENKRIPVKEIKVTEIRPKPSSIQNIEGLYKKGISLIESKNYRDAISTFYNIVKYNPQHNLADNAQWWIGEAYYFMGEYNNALDAYSKVFNLGDGNKSAYARYRMGLCYLKMGNKKKAVEQLEKVIKNYPVAKEERQKALQVLKNIRGS